MEDNKIKTTNIILFGKLIDIKKGDKVDSIKLLGTNEMITWCFLKSKDDYHDLIDCDVVCSGTMQRRPLTSKQTNKTLGWETVYNIFKITKSRPRSGRIVDEEA